VSEFSLILIALALNQGIVTRDIFSLVVLLMTTSMVCTVYISSIEKWLYFKLSKTLSFFEKLSLTKRMHYEKKRRKKDIVLFGMGEMGGVFLNTFKKLKKKVLVVDYNPSIIKDMQKEKVNCLYGDIVNEEVLKAADLSRTDIIVSTIRDVSDNQYLIQYAKRIKSKSKIIVVADRLHQALDLYEVGADYVIIPRVESGEKMSSLITGLLKGKKRMETLRKDHIRHIILLEKFKYTKLS